MKRVKIISCDHPELIGKEADIMMPHNNVAYINGQKIQFNYLKVNILEDSSVIDVTYIVFNMMPDTFPMRSLTETTLCYCYDHKIQTDKSNIERRFRELRNDRGKISYQYDGKIHAYRKLALPERAIQETIKYE